MMHFFLAIQVTGYVVARPPQAKEGTLPLQLLYHLSKPGIFGEACALSAQERHHQPSRLFPIRVDLPGLWISEVAPEEILGVSCAGLAIRQDGRRRSVPGHNPPSVARAQRPGEDQVPSPLVADRD